tara:strand:- start:3832 stop:4233 length:402 start_codon:yes stop_codon:yes gene_type:complete
MIDIHDYVDRFKHTKFEWNKFDCATFAFGWIDLKYGTTYVKDHITGQYECEKTAREAAEIAGPKWAFLESYFSTKAVIDGFQNKGDILCYSYDCWNPIALVLSPNRVACVNESGLHIVKPEHIFGKHKYIRIG